MSLPNTPSQGLQDVQEQLDDDIQKLRDAQAFRTLEEKVQDLKDQGINPTATYDANTDEEQ